MAKKKLKAIPKEYSVTLRLGSDTFQGTGSDFGEALESLPVPVKLMMKGSVTLEQGEKRLELFYMPMKLRQMLRPIALPYTAKQFTLLLK